MKTKYHPPFFTRPLVLALAMLPAIPAARAVTTANVSSIYQFNPLHSEGAGAQSVLITGTDGNYYGTTPAGGTTGKGTVFQLTTAGKLTVLHNFTALDSAGNNADGASPAAGLVLGGDGNFYGTTQYGGTHGTGALFKITSAGVLTTLHSFTSLNKTGGNSDGANPYAPLIQALDGNFYGTTVHGGASGAGTIFKMAPDGRFTDFHNFTVRDAMGHNTEGAEPYAGLVQASDGSFYGAGSVGGASGNGTIFKLLSGGTVFPIYSFQPVDGTGNNTGGTTPYATPIQGADGILYGTAVSGGAHAFGAIFRVTTGGVFTSLHDFSATNAKGVNSDGAFPYASLFQTTNGSFFGTAAGGGAGANGTVFKITSNGVFSTAHSFVASSAKGSNTEGAAPFSGLVPDGNGGFYAVTSSGGFGNNGTIYQYNELEGLSVVHTFEKSTNSGGSTPLSGLVRGADGLFYGTSAFGGAGGSGTVFKVSANGNFTSLYNFSALDSEFNNSDGSAPNATLIRGIDGLFYGTTTQGGVHGTGTVFKITDAGVLTNLHSFGTNAVDEGGLPYGGLVQGSDGNFYGATYFGGINFNGTIFRVTPAGVLTVLHQFSAVDNNTHNSDGASPNASLLRGSDGMFYGTTVSGGAHGVGTIFRITAAGALATLHDFDTLPTLGVNNEGYGVAAALIEGADGNFYGTAELGGANGGGTIFGMTPGQDFAVLHTFSALDASNHNADGFSPEGALLQSTDGLFYGTTANGGGSGDGTVFRVTKLGTFETLHQFAGLEGSSPGSALVQDANGTFYGTTTRGGVADGGTVFAMVLGPDITSALTVTGSMGKAFSYQITALNGPTSFSASGLPAGLTIDTATGKISGAPTTAGTYTVAIGAANAGGQDSAQLNLTIKASPPVITSALTATAATGSTFSYKITATNSPTKYGESGLPAGLAIDQVSGSITGKPTVTGTFTVTIAAFNAIGSGSAKLKLTVALGKPVITSSLSETVKMGSAFSYQITATNSPASYGESGIPAGLTINTATGKISGTPTVAGTFTVTIAGFNSAGSGVAKLTLTVTAAPPTITSALTDTATVGSVFSYQITATNKPASYGASGLPAGLTINQTTGKISGTPTKAGTSTVTIAAFNATGSGSAKLTLIVQ